MKLTVGLFWGILICLSVQGQQKEKESLANLVKQARSIAYQDPDSSLTLTKKALALAIEADDHELEIDAMNNLAKVYFLLGEAVKTEEVANQVLNQPMAKPRQLFSATLMLANLKTQLFEDQFTAIQYYLKAKQIAETNKLDSKLPAIYNDLGTAFSMVNNYDKAEEYYHLALSLGNSHKFRGGIFYNLAKIASIREDIPLAVKHSKMALETWKKTGKGYYLIYSYTQLIELYETIDTTQVNAYLDTLIETSGNMSNPEVTSWVDLTKGQVALRRKRYRNALTYITKCYNVLKDKNGPPDLLQEARRDLLQVYKQLNMPEEALAISSEIIEIREKEEEEQFDRLGKQVDQYLERNEELEEAQNTAEALEEKANKVSQIAILVSAFLLVTLAMLLYILLLIRKRNRINQNLKSANQEKQDLLNQLSATNRELTLANDQILSMNEELEGKVADRTNEVLKKNEALFSYGYWNAHRLRGPIANIMGLLALLRAEGNISEELSKEEILEQLQVSVKKLDDTVIEFNRKLSSSDKGD